MPVVSSIVAAAEDVVGFHSTQLRSDCSTVLFPCTETTLDPAPGQTFTFVPAIIDPTSSTNVSSAKPPLSVSVPPIVRSVTPPSVKAEASSVLIPTPPESCARVMPCSESVSLPMTRLVLASVMSASRLSTSVLIPPPPMIASLPRPPVKKSAPMPPMSVSSPPAPSSVTEPLKTDASS